MRIEEDLLLDILDAIAAIEKYTSQEMENSESEELIQVWVLHHLQIIGEACRAMPQKFQDKSFHTLEGHYWDEEYSGSSLFFH